MSSAIRSDKASQTRLHVSGYIFLELFEIILNNLTICASSNTVGYKPYFLNAALVFDNLEAIYRFRVTIRAFHGNVRRFQGS